MSRSLSRRSFAVAATGAVVGSHVDLQAEEKPKTDATTTAPTIATAGPTEAPFERDYPAPEFRPSWKRPQINKLLVQEFVIYAHSDAEMVKKLLEKEPGLIAATINWGAGDWESGLGAASHMGRRDIVEILLEQGGAHRSVLRRDAGNARAGKGVSDDAAEVDRR